MTTRARSFRVVFAALIVATGEKAAHYKRRRIEFLDFMNSIVADYAGREIHVFWTTSTPTSRSAIFGWPIIPTCISTSRRPTRPG